MQLPADFDPTLEAGGSQDVRNQDGPERVPGILGVFSGSLRNRC